jgi:hypothetical protein
MHTVTPQAKISLITWRKGVLMLHVISGIGWMGLTLLSSYC